jgi:hypothetical protein
VLALVLFTTACAQPKLSTGDDLDGKLWEDQKASLPPYPKQGSLVPIYVSPAIPFAFFVDAVSVSVGQDGVVRYTLIARSASAVMNVSYEGMRCETYERKVYAFGRSDGTWSQARNSQWTPISSIQPNQHLTLAVDFFCSQRVQNSEQALRALVRGNQPR